MGRVGKVTSKNSYVDKRSQSSNKNIKSVRKSKKNDTCVSGLNSGLGAGLDLPQIKLSQNGCVYTFVCSENQFNHLVKCIKPRYWNDFGESDKYDVNWREVRCNAGHGEVVEHLVKVFEVAGDEKNQIFTITMYKRLRKVMTQGTHRDLWKKVEFTLLFCVANAVIREDKSYSDAYFDCTNVRIVITEEDLVPSDHECDDEQEFQGEQLPITEDDFSSDEENDNNKLICKKRTPRKSITILSTPRRKTKPKVQKKLNEPEQRLKNLEDTLYHLESNLGQDMSDTLATEQVISELIESKVSQFIKDIKQQHKNEIKLLHDKIKDIEELHQKEVQELKAADKKLRNQLKSVNDRCNRIEKRLKDEENSATQVSKQLFEMEKSVSNLEDKSVSSQADYFTIEERLKILTDRIASNQSTPTRVTECVQVINENTKSKEIKSLSTAPQDVTLEGKNTYAAAAAKVILPETPCSPDSAKPEEDFTLKKPMNNHNNKWDVVYLMDSNQKFLNRNRLFPGKMSLGLRCGNIESVRRVLSKPRFEQPEALLIHVGVNDIENLKIT